MGVSINCQTIAKQIQMGRLFWFYVVCILSIPMFTYEIINTFVDENYRNFQFFTVITNFLTWLYFIMKGIYVLYKYCKQDKKKNNLGDDQSAILLCPTDKMGIFLDGYSIFTTINMLLVCAVFWAMLAATTVCDKYSILSFRRGDGRGNRFSVCLTTWLFRLPN